jgi:serine/threonine protein kinase
LGSGNFGKVFLAFHNVNYEFKVAVKTMKKKKIGENLKKLKSEIKILSKLDHPNICKYYETYESPNYVYLIMEYCGGGDLFDRITSQKEGSNFSEQKAAIIMKKLFLAINHCHTNGVVHRDLKPENIMYKENKNSNSSIDDVKIIDFGLSKLL